MHLGFGWKLVHLEKTHTNSGKTQKGFSQNLGTFITVLLIILFSNFLELVALLLKQIHDFFLKWENTLHAHIYWDWIQSSNLVTAVSAYSSLHNVAQKWTLNIEYSACACCFGVILGQAVCRKLACKSFVMCGEKKQHSVYPLNCSVHKI